MTATSQVKASATDGASGDAAARPGASRARVARAGTSLALLSLLALLAPAVGREFEALLPSVDFGQPYLRAYDAPLQFVRLPLALLGSFALVLAPGLMAALALGLAESGATWVVYGTGLALLGTSAVAALVQALTRAPLVGAPFVASVLGLHAATTAWALWRAERVRWPLEGGTGNGDGRRGAELRALVWPLLGVLLLALALTPKLFWENLNGDGAHAYEASRLLLHRALPFWPAGAGDVRAFPGLNSALFTFPNAWFLRLFGEREAGVRLPFLLELYALGAVVVALCEQRADRGDRHGRQALRGHARWAIALGLASYALVMAYSATYDPYCSDIGLPATQDTLTLFCLCAAALAHSQARPLLTALFAFFTLCGSPAGPMLLAAWCAGVWIGSRGTRWRSTARAALPVALAVLVAAATPRLLEIAGLPAPGREHDAGQLLKKFRYLQIGDARRLVFLIVPAGIYPVLGFFQWKRADALARALGAVALAVFGLYYALAFVSQHYFVPAMVLPLIVFWRCDALRGRAWSASAKALTVSLALLALALGLPRTTAIATAAREVGATIDVAAIPGYDAMEPQSFRAADLLAQLFTPGWLPQVPEEAYAGSSLVWNFYAQRAPPGGPRAYRLEPLAPAAGSEIPSSAESAAALAENEIARLVVLDPEAHERHRRLRPVDCRGLALYDLPRDVLFARREGFERFGVLDVRGWLGRLVHPR